VGRGELMTGSETIGRQLAAHFEQLIRRLRALAPDYEPPAFSLSRLRSLMGQGSDEHAGDLPSQVVGRLRRAVNQDWLDLDTWKGLWFMVNYTLQYNAGVVKRRFSGDYESDEWGLDWEFLDAFRPLLSFLYKVYWRVETTGLDRIPVEGPALLVANRSGFLPWDGLMVTTAVLTEHPSQRLVRALHGAWLASLPFVSHVAVKLGQVSATADNGTRLLAQGELVAVFPEGNAGSVKPLKDRYKLAGFGQGDFVRWALESKIPIIPVAVVGAEEANMTLATSPVLARATGLPHFPITPTFPWLGWLGLLPFPTRWSIDFGEPISVDEYGPQSARNIVLVSQLTDQVRHVIQDMVRIRVARRQPAIFGGAGPGAGASGEDPAGPAQDQKGVTHG
jgi:1-acyl-sn-glycerol-3-phosphate acyltransferase